jgi:hypothetical protein
VRRFPFRVPRHASCPGCGGRVDRSDWIGQPVGDGDWQLWHTDCAVDAGWRAWLSGRDAGLVLVS